MIRVSDVPWIFRTVIRKLGQTSTIAVAVILLIVTVAVGSAIVTIEEVAGGGAGPKTYPETFWWFTNAITGLGLKAVAPTLEGAQATSAVVLTFARIFFGMFIGAVAAGLINRFLMEGKGMGDVTLRGHAVICGWNARGYTIIKQLTTDERAQEVVILADLENSPVRDSRVHFVRGDPTTDKDLRRASVQNAETVIILADPSVAGLSDSTMDARSVLVALAVETLNKSVYTVAEVRQAENRHHFEHASVDEILVSNELNAQLLARASVNHGLTRIVTDLLTNDGSSEIYIIPTPSSLIGKPFDDVLIHLQSAHRVILMGLTRGDEILLNPKDPVIVTRGDQLIVIAHERPILD